jgi:hypothetical protein
VIRQYNCLHNKYCGYSAVTCSARIMRYAAELRNEKIRRMDVEISWDIVLYLWLLNQKTRVFSNTAVRTSNLAFTFCSLDETLLNLSSEAVG